MNDSTDFKTYKCPYCGGNVELDAALLPPDKSQEVACPHCAEPFSIPNPFSHIPITPASTLPTLPPAPKISPVSTYQRPKKKHSVIMLGIASVVFFMLGGVLFLDGETNSYHESMNENGSAIRQTVYVLETGFGGCIMVLSLILRALTKLITK